MIRSFCAFMALVCVGLLALIINEWSTTNDHLIIAGGLFVLSCIFSWFAALNLMWQQKETSWTRARIEESKLVRYSSMPGRRG
jgi:hypothetical protein